MCDSNIDLKHVTGQTAQGLADLRQRDAALETYCGKEERHV